MKVLGHMVPLSEGRLVFVGYDGLDHANVYIAIRNAEGDDKYLRFTPEAAEALRALLNGEHSGASLVEYPHKDARAVLKLWANVLSGSGGE